MIIFWNFADVPLGVLLSAAHIYSIVSSGWASGFLVSDDHFQELR
jgi:hypothetical protein